MSQPQGVAQPSTSFVESRTFYQGASLVCGALLITILSLALTEGSTEAKLILDMTSEDQTFPYPFTIQNFLFLLLAAGIGDVLYRRSATSRELRALHSNLLPEEDQSMVTPDDVARLRHKVRSSSTYAPGYVCTLIDESLTYFQSNRSAANTHQLLNSLIELELHRVDLRYTFLRYVCWLIPTIGFIGTVVGIAGGLSYMTFGGEGADAATQMKPVIDSLALAFNTTIMALIFSAILVQLTQSAQRREEEAINSASEYCLRNLINRLYTPPAN
jgi:biopolymer transport protein ExbB/TolQ